MIEFVITNTGVTSKAPPRIRRVDEYIVIMLLNNTVLPMRVVESEHKGVELLVGEYKLFGKCVKDGTHIELAVHNMNANFALVQLKISKKQFEFFGVDRRMGVQRMWVEDKDDIVLTKGQVEEQFGVVEGVVYGIASQFKSDGYDFSIGDRMICLHFPNKLCFPFWYSRDALYICGIKLPAKVGITPTFYVTVDEINDSYAKFVLTIYGNPTLEIEIDKEGAGLLGSRIASADIAKAVMLCADKCHPGWPWLLYGSGEK